MTTRELWHVFELPGFELGSPVFAALVLPLFLLSGLKHQSSP